MSSKIKICVLSEYAYPLLTGQEIRFGGAELQMVILANELKKRSYDVSFVTFSKTENTFEKYENINVYNPYNIEFKGYHHFYPQNIYKLLKTIKKIDADIYIQRAGSHLTGFLAFITKLKNKTFIFSSSSNSNVSTALEISTIKDIKKIFYRFGVKYSTYVLCQSIHQKQLLKKTIGKNSSIIKNAYIPPEINKNNKNDNEKILWVGRIVKEKRPGLFLKLAKDIPELNFWMIGNIRDPEYYQKIKNSADKIKNLEFIGTIPHDKIDKYYAESTMLINTSATEGFPNIFIEAWGNNIPVVSLGFDPDEIICKYELGFHVKNYDDLTKKTYTLQKNTDLRKKMGGNGRKYVEKEHNVEKIIDEYEQIFKDLIISKNINHNG